MDPVWRLLPDHLVLRILEFSTEIDQRLAFKIPPRKLTLDRTIKFQNEIVYDLEKETMRQVEVDEDDQVLTFWRRGLKLSMIRPGPIYIFNMEWEPYELTMYTGEYAFGPATCSNHVVINKTIKFV